MVLDIFWLDPGHFHGSKDKPYQIYRSNLYQWLNCFESLGTNTSTLNVQYNVVFSV